MPAAAPSTAESLRAALLALARGLDEGLTGDALASVVEPAKLLWEAYAQAFGLVLLDDHDPHVAPGLHEAREPGPLALARVRQVARSWEKFDRAFEACSWDLEQQLFDERIAPCVLSLGVSVAEVDLAQDHLFVIDERYVASFPAERWDQHAARHEALAERDGVRTLKGLRRVTSG